MERGGFPEPCLAEQAEDADRWRRQYFTDLIREDDAPDRMQTVRKQYASRAHTLRQRYFRRRSGVDRLQSAPRRIPGAGAHSRCSQLAQEHGGLALRKSVYLGIDHDRFLTSGPLRLETFESSVRDLVVSPDTTRTASQGPSVGDLQVVSAASQSIRHVQGWQGCEQGNMRLSGHRYCELTGFFDLRGSRLGVFSTR